MALSTIDLSALKSLQKKLQDLKGHDYSPLMLQWRQIMVDDNRRGLLAGLDKNDQPLKVTWREQHTKSQWVTTKNGKRFLMKGSREAGTGPPLVPNRANSRAIKNVETAHGRAGSEWFAMLGWRDFETNSGRPVLPMHAHPRNAPYPRRDVIGVRPTGRKLARDAAKAYILSAWKSK